MQKQRLAFFDLECTNLNADWGLIICGTVKFSDRKKPQTFRITDYERGNIVDDSGVCAALRDVLNEAPIWVTWYGQRFDVPYLQSRLLYWGQEPMSTSTKHLDLWRTARYQLRLSSNRLANIERFLNLKGSKTPINQGAWLMALDGDKKAMKTVTYHCEQDVLMLEEAYYKMLPFIKDHPHIGLFDSALSDGCPKCGSHNLHRRGSVITKMKRYQRWQCQDCGSWHRSRIADKREPLELT